MALLKNIKIKYSNIIMPYNKLQHSSDRLFLFDETYDDE